MNSRKSGLTAVGLAFQPPGIPRSSVGDGGHYLRYATKVHFAQPDGRAFTVTVHLMRWPIASWNPADVTLRLSGPDGKSGLCGGPTPESESIVIRFRGAERPGEYRAKLRIVTQAMNVGVLSAGEPGEPPVNLHYIDIPIGVRVSP